MITYKHLEHILKAISENKNFFVTLNNYNISPVEFFQYLSKNPDDAMKFDQVRQIGTEKLLQDCLGAMRDAPDRFQLDKAISMFKASQWFAEKIIPKTYGQRIEVNHNVSPDIKGILEEAEQRRAIAVKGYLIESKSDLDSAHLDCNRLDTHEDSAKSITDEMSEQKRKALEMLGEGGT